MKHALATALCLTFGITGSTSWANQDGTESRADFRGVILIIGDGFDHQHVAMGRHYLVGHEGRLTLDRLPVSSAVQVQTLTENGEPEYVADSANTATSLATGVIASIGRVGTDHLDRDVVTVLEMAAQAELKTGIVTTASVTDATPASFMAHVANRGCENPQIILGGERYGSPYAGCPEDATSNGGLGSIAEQIAQSPVDVVLGGGRSHFSVPLTASTEKTSLDLAEANGFAVLTESDALTTSTGSPKLLGLFADEHLPVRMQGTEGRVAEAPDTSLLNKVDERLGSVVQPEPMNCEANPAYGDTPPLSALTEVALKTLSANNDRGFFLMVESASIDKQSHRRNPCGSIGEIAQLEESLAVALAFADSHPDVLVIVTADHAQAAQVVPDTSLYAALPVPIYTPGKIARIRTPEGRLLAVNYATNNFYSEEHTGADVPLYANKNPNNALGGYLRQTDVFHVIRDYLMLTNP